MNNEHFSDGDDKTIDELRSMSIDKLLAHGGNIRRRYRDQGYLQAARRELRKTLQVVDEHMEAHRNVSKAEAAKLLFEDSYIAFLLGETNEAVAMMEKHNEFCEAENDAVGLQIGLFRIAHTKLFGRQITPSDAERLVRDCLLQFADLKTKGIEVRRCENWIFNTQGRLFDLAIETGDIKEAQHLLKQFKSNEQVRTDLDLLPPDLTTLRILHSREARLHSIKGDHDRALSHFAVILDLDLQQWGEPNDKIIDANAKLQELARDYYFCGLTLKAKGLEAAAKTAFNTGLALNPQLANYYFQDLIEECFSN